MGAGDCRDCWPYFPMFYFLTTFEAEAGKKTLSLSTLSALAEDPGLGSQHPHDSSQLSLPPVLGYLIPFFQPLRAVRKCVVHRHIFRYNTHTQKLKIHLQNVFLFVGNIAASRALTKLHGRDLHALPLLCQKDHILKRSKILHYLNCPPATQCTA